VNRFFTLSKHCGMVRMTRSTIHTSILFQLMPFGNLCCKDLMLTELCITLSDMHTSTYWLEWTNTDWQLQELAEKNQKLSLSRMMFQVSTVLSELIREIFRARLEKGCCTLRADGYHMMLWLTCLSSSHLPLLTTVWLKCITFELWRCAFILNSRQFLILEQSSEYAWLWFIPPVAIVRLQCCIGSEEDRKCFVGQ